jgi:membrane protease YdiL (CAAX protease family)
MLGADARSRHKARRGLAIFFAIVVPLSAIFEALIIVTGNFSWLIPLVWVPALASVVARLVLREGFSDVSFRLGGRRGWSAIVLALIFPIVVGLIAYGIAWVSALARFVPRSDLAGDGATPLTAFVVILAASTTIGTIALALTAAGEEIGWRGYMLTRLIDAGVPRPVLVSGLLWGLWHVAGTLTGVYATGPSPVLSAMLLMVTITSLSYVIGRMRLQTGSIWPAIAVHAAWNAVIVGAFDSVTTGAGAALWVGESGVLTALTLVVAAFLFSRGHWTIRRQPEAQRSPRTSSPTSLT